MSNQREVQTAVMDFESVEVEARVIIDLFDVVYVGIYRWPHASGSPGVKIVARAKVASCVPTWFTVISASGTSAAVTALVSLLARVR